MAFKLWDRKTATLLLTIAAFLFFASLIILMIFPKIYQNKLKKELELVEGSIEYNIWQDLPIPIYESLYFFNITNGKEFKQGKESVLNVTQVGPYTYKSSWVKENIRWYPNSTVSYQERRTYQFVPEKSLGSEEDEIFTLNGPMIIAADIAKNWDYKWKFALGLFFAGEGEKLVTKKSIKQLTYGGYEDAIIKRANWIKKGLPFKNGIFSWLYGKNDTYDGTFTVFTGETDINQLNVINKWNGVAGVNFWKNDSCNMINGSSGEMGPPIRNGQKEYTFFQSMFCRSVTFTYTSDATHQGVKSKRFIASEKVFGNETVNPENSCFDIKPHLRTGVQDISPCQFGAPVVVSFPHFYLADPYYLTQIHGLRPNSEEHSSHIDVEPRTGISMDILIRFQINLELQPIKDLGQFEKVPNGVFPVLWVEISASITKELADFLKISLNRPKIILYSVTGITLAISLILFILSIVIIYRVNRKNDTATEPMLGCNGEVKSYCAIEKEEKNGNCKEKEKGSNREKEKSFDVGSSNHKQSKETYNSQVTANNPTINQSEQGNFDDDEPLLVINA